MSLEAAYNTLYSSALIILGLLIGAMVVRSVIGPRITDRILSINMIGTMVIASIAILSRLLDEGYLADVALIYAMISFISVLTLARIYIPSENLREIGGQKAYDEAKAMRAQMDSAHDERAGER